MKITMGKKMKNNRLIISSTFMSAVLMLGCQDDFLVRAPTGRETEADFFKTEEQTLRALTAAYDILGWGAVTETHEWFIGDIASDDALKGGENKADQGDVQSLRDFKPATTNSVLTERWSALYQGIHRANLVIENAHKALDMTDSMKARVIGEATFLRGYYFFSLMNTFGPVPLITKTLGAPEYCSARATKAATWAQIENDFRHAGSVLPKKSNYAPTDMGRATQGAAKAYLVKAYIYQKKWAEAMALADSIIVSDQYSLTNTYADIFKVANENGRESIFEVQHTFFSTGEWGDDNEGQVTSIFQGNRTSKYQEGWGFNDPTQNFVNEFEPGDERLAATVIKAGDTLWADGAPEVADMSKSWTGFHNRKYLVDFLDPTPEMSNDPKNWRAYRYADLLLFHAEAAMELNNLAVAKVSLNKVRIRAGLADAIATTQIEYRAAIYHERRVELGMEGHRFFDVVRQGRGPTVFTDSTRTFVAGKNEVFPIPNIETQLCKELTTMP
jgi:starch-binding outer membrane protein, SusD/RagB family